MADELFREDGYVSEFEGEVSAVDGDWVALGGTAFYPGGGGQVCDTGAIAGLPVTEVKYVGGEIMHRVPGHAFKVGDRAWCSVDWNRRYDLMKGHTAEHILFNALRRQDPELGIVKIYISPESKYVIVDRDVGWDAIEGAVEFANGVVRRNLPVTKSMMSRSDPEMERVRVKLERIEGDEVTVVEIGDVDIAACSGVHVMETGEVGAIFVDRKASAGRDGVAIHFKVDAAAVDAAMGLACTALRVVDELGSKPGDVTRTVANMKRELESSRRQLRASAESALGSMEPDRSSGVDIYAGTFHVTDRRALTDAAESYRSRGGVAAIVGIGDGLTALLASGSDRVDCRAALSSALQRFGGRGGGKPGFAQGGAPDPSDADAVLEALVDAVRAQLRRPANCY